MRNQSDDKQRQRVKDLYNCKEDITAYLVDSGTRVGNTTKSKLAGGSVDDL